ncbi:hypothetical protein AB1E18_009030 [Capra hircus]
MRPENQSSVSRFLLRGLPIRPEQQGAFFALFLGVYLTTVLGNLLVLLLIRLDPRLHTPTYFFLSHLALTDVSFSSVTLPKMLVNTQTQCQAITYAGIPDSDRRNQTGTYEFFLMGLSEHPEQQPLLFGLFLGMYLVTVWGNLLIILAIGSDVHLHTPMYLFLANLSFSDIGFISTVIPKMLNNIGSGSRRISYAMENFLLAVMAYDRYIAICHPFRYCMILNRKLCSHLVAVCHILSHLHALLHTFLMGRLIFCADNRIPHFFCDLYPLMKVSCSSTHLNTLMIHTEGVIVISGALAIIMASYACIISAVLQSPSAKGKWRAFSTCGSHLTVVAIFYGTLTWVYFRPLTSYSVAGGRILTVMYTVVTPMLNPFIYSLRNKDVKGAFRKWMNRIWTSSFR